MAAPRLVPPLAVAVAGGVLAGWAVARARRELSARRAEVHHVLDADEEAVAAIASRMAADGLPVRPFEERFEELPGGLVVVRWGLAYPGAARTRVSRWLAAEDLRSRGPAAPAGSGAPAG